jgi:hypothetical protein
VILTSKAKQKARSVFVFTPRVTGKSNETVDDGTSTTGTTTGASLGSTTVEENDHTVEPAREKTEQVMLLERVSEWD